jgi:hypothetical protein
MKFLKQSWPLRDLLSSSKSNKSRVIKLTMAGLLGTSKFIAAVKESGQTITFCGVNAHFQNAVAERRIRTVQHQARIMLIHAQHRCGPRLFMLIYGLMLSKWPMKFTTLHQQLEERITKLLARY